MLNLATIAPVEYRSERVLTTHQLADGYETNSKSISYNFNNNRKRYEEGKHYYSLSGSEKREFVNCLEIHDSSKNASTLYLWTERGALLHAKSLNTDKAWQVYDILVECYFRVKQVQFGTNHITALEMIVTQLKQQEASVSAVNQRIDNIETKYKHATAIHIQPLKFKKLNVLDELLRVFQNRNSYACILTDNEEINANLIRLAQECLEDMRGMQLAAIYGKAKEFGRIDNAICKHPSNKPHEQYLTREYMMAKLCYGFEAIYKDGWNYDGKYKPETKEVVYV